ncbi:MAG: discoidin domain-containing protein [Bacteroides sp.]|nr:discoidin domain-containing protein [Bacteroides sp.]
MKRIILGSCLLMALAGCDDKLETFEVTGSDKAPVAIEASSVQGEALPGQIKLTWTPNEGYEYVKISYHDPLQDKDVCQICSNTTGELLIDNTRARYGDYTFNFQTFNARHEGGQTVQVKARSGAAPATYTEKGRTKVELDVSQISADQADSSEGQLKHLVDGSTGTFFSSNWHGSGTTYPSYIQVDFAEEHENFAIGYVNRTDDGWRTSGRPASVELQVSANGTDWQSVSTLSSLPSSAGSEYTTNYIMPGFGFKHLRYVVTSATGSASYYCFAEFYFYDVTVEVYDPETMEE